MSDDNVSGAFHAPIPPHNFDAEQAILGALLLNNRAWEQIADFLRPEHFAEPSHATIYAACQKLINRGQVASPVTLTTYLAQDQSLGEVGGTSYLAALVGNVVSLANTGDYGRLVFDLHLRREIIALAAEMETKAFSPDMDLSASEQLSEAESRLFELANTGQIEGGLSAFSTAMTRALDVAAAAHKRGGKLSGLTTGFIDLNAALGGLHPSDLVILAGRPGMGKTALAANIAFNAAKAFRLERDQRGNTTVVDGGVVAFFSLEMSQEQLATRLMAEHSRVPGNRIRQGELTQEEFERFSICAGELERLNLYIDDTPALTVAAVRTRARRLMRQRGLGLIVIDYLQLLQGGSRRNEGRVQELSEITRGLKSLAKELHVPVLALSQLSRAVESREDKRPQLSDLRESGTIEQDADMVLFVFREEYYLSKEPAPHAEESMEKFNARYEQWRQRKEEVRNTAEVIIAKQRHGPTSTIKLAYHGEFTKFSDLADLDRLPDGH